MKKYLGFAAIAVLAILLFGGVGCNMAPRQENAPVEKPSEQQKDSLKKDADRLYGQKPDSKPAEKAPIVRPSSVPQPPSGEISLYKGFWMPCSFMDDSCQPMNNIATLKEMGINIIGIAPKIEINSKGDIASYPIDFIDQRLGEIVKRYYSAGLRIFISPELDFDEALDLRTGAEPKPIPAAVAANPQFTEKYDVLIIEIAKLAEKYHVEMFSPMNEPDIKLGTSAASKWAQNILPAIKGNYHGKILWKVGLAGASNRAVNFKGYDVIGIDFTAPGPPEAQALANFPPIVDGFIAEALSWAKRDGIPKVILSEVGVWGGALRLSEAGKAKIYKIIFEQGAGKVDGFIILDDPPDLGWSMKNTLSAEEIKSWFLEKL